MSIKSTYHRLEPLAKRLEFNSRDRRLVKKYDLPALTPDEVRAIREAWPCLDIRKADLVWSRINKKLNGFSPYFLNDFQYWQILCKVNPKAQVAALQNKAMCDVYFPAIPFPEPLVRCLNGTFFDKDLKCIGRGEAAGILAGAGGYVIKPSVGSYCGRGVRKVSSPDMAAVLDSIDGAGDNFIAQKVVRQHGSISRLNPTSLNCFRVTSVFIGGKYGSSTVIKIGKKGAGVDNWNSSYIAGVSPDGKVGREAYDVDLNPVTRTDNGIMLDGLEMPFLPALLGDIENWHRSFFPNCGVVGWDVTVDEEGRPAVIETNLEFPGILAEQLCAGPFFEGYREEISTFFPVVSSHSVEK